MTEPGLAIAIVDDEEPVRKALGRLLRAAGHQVTTFASGGAFLEALPSPHPDCTILDLHIPGLSGLDILERLAHQKPEFACIVITGKDEPGMRNRVLAAGAKAYLTKPLDEQTLLTTIQSASTKTDPKHLIQDTGPIHHN